MKKDLNKGQHFLINKEILKKEIKTAQIKKTDKIIEIGAGGGFLTQELTKHSKDVLSFEIDKKLKTKLQKIKSNNLKFIFDNAFNYSWKNYNKIVSNIPYHLSEKIIKKSIIEEIQELTLIIGEKYKNKLKMNNTKSSILANLFFEINFIQKISKDSFSPPPRTNSWLIHLNRKPNSQLNNTIYSILFYKGKTKNSIIYSLVKQNYTKNQAKAILKKLNLPKHILEKPSSKITSNVLKKIIEIFT